jgi:hypothetical protein
MSDRFTRGPRHAPEPPNDGDLALRVREEMRAAVSNVRAGASAGALAADEVALDAERSVQKQPDGS